MARIRSIKPDMRRSLTVCSWPYPVRWTFVGLPGYMDDYGRGIDDARLIKAELYPLDDDMTPKKIENHLRQISENGPLCRYEVDGRRYLHLTSWDEHQKPNRPTESRIPKCPIHEKNGPDAHVHVTEDSVTPHGGLTESSVSQHGVVTEGSSLSRAPAEQVKGAGSREQGTREERATRDLDRFDEFWNTYPRRVAKPDALKAYAKAVRRADPDLIVNGARRYRDDPNRDDPFTAHPATWLNRDGWNDGPLPPRSRPSGTSAASHLQAWER